MPDLQGNPWNPTKIKMFLWLEKGLFLFLLFLKAKTENENKQFRETKILFLQMKINKSFF